MSNNFATDYIDVAARIGIFREKFPAGSLQPANPEQPYSLLTVGDQTFVVVVAAAYRNPDDPRPGVGMAQELIPGRTQFTKGSELQNAETSAWGRAIVAALAADTKQGVASADEVRNRRAEQDEAQVIRETDLAWMEAFDQRITVAASVAEVRELWRERGDVYQAGRVTDVDDELLRKALTVRKDELEPTP